MKIGQPSDINSDHFGEEEPKTYVVNLEKVRGLSEPPEKRPDSRNFCLHHQHRSSSHFTPKLQGQKVDQGTKAQTYALRRTNMKRR